MVLAAAEREGRAWAADSKSPFALGRAAGGGSLAGPGSALGSHPAGSGPVGQRLAAV